MAKLWTVEPGWRKEVTKGASSKTCRCSIPSCYSSSLLCLSYVSSSSILWNNRQNEPSPWDCFCQIFGHRDYKCNKILCQELGYWGSPKTKRLRMAHRFESFLFSMHFALLLCLRLTSSSLYSWGWPLTPDPPASIPLLQGICSHCHSENANKVKPRIRGQSPRPESTFRWPGWTIEFLADPD